MANKIGNRVKMTVASTGTADITLGSAIGTFQSLSAAGISNGDTIPYAFEDSSSWEIGVATVTVTAGVYSISRSVTASSNAGLAINLSAYAVFMLSPLAADLQSGTAASNLVRLDGSAKMPAVDGSALTSLNAANLASGTIPAARLPNPAVSTKGGILSATAPSNQFMTGVDTSGNPTFEQPSAANVSGLAASATTDATNAANISSGTLPAARLPNPAAAALGGVNSKAVVTHQFLTGIGTDGSVSASQPAASDISGLAASATTDTTNASNISSGTLPAARLPNPAAAALGGVLSAFAASHQFMTGISTSGVPLFAQPAAGDVSGLAASATTDTTNASNISSGTLAIARCPTGTGSNALVYTDANGSVGIGTATKSTTLKSVFLPTNGIFSYNGTSGYLTANAYYNTAWKYGSSAGATLYQLTDTAHIWSYAASGTADANITWLEALRVDGSTGNVKLANSLSLAASTYQTLVKGSASNAADWTLTLPSSAGTNKYALTTNGSGVSSWSQIDLSAAVTGTLPVANGGTGLTSLTAGYIPYGNGTGAFGNSAALQFDGSNFGVGVTPIVNTRIYTRTAATTDTAYYADNGVNTGFQVKFGNSITNIGNDFNQPIAFFTNGYTNERMRIASDGSVGIGTSSPLCKLNVSSSDAARIFLVSGSTYGMRVGTDGTGGIIEGVDKTGTASYAPLSIGGSLVNLTINGSAKAMLDASGNLGVGVTSPAASASSKSTIEASGCFVFGGAINAHQTSRGVFEYSSNKVTMRAYGATAGTGYIAFNTGGGGGSADTEAVRIDSSQNLLVGMSAAAANTTKTIHIVNTTAPTANASGGGILYVEAGALKYRGSSGTVTTLGAA